MAHKLGRFLALHSQTTVRGLCTGYVDQPCYPPVTKATVADLTRKEFAELVKSLPNVPEKIRMVSPDERPWTSAERRWHRPWMRPLINPRGAYRVSCPPDGYNLLPFYKYLTNTQVVKGLPADYATISVSQPTEQLQPFFVDALHKELSLMSTSDQTADDDRCRNFLANVTNAVVVMLSRIAGCNMDFRVDRGAPIAAFWIRGGFQSLYTQNGNKSNGERIVADSEYGLGELAFSYRQNICTQIRMANPLTPISLDEQEALLISEKNATVDAANAIFAPNLIGMVTDDNPLRMAPGFEYGDPNEFSLLITNTLGDVYAKLARWEAEVEELEDCVVASAVATCFAALVGQAHYLGFTQHNDVVYPLTAQLVLTDLQNWYFFAYKLNTLALIDDHNAMPNLCFYDGPKKLFADDQLDVAMAQQILATLMRFCCRPVVVQQSDTELRPYLSQRLPFDSTLVDHVV